MNIFIAKSGTRQGPYSLAQVKDMIRRREVSMSDNVWYEGCVQWTCIANLPELLNEIVPPLPPERPQSANREDLPLPRPSCWTRLSTSKQNNSSALKTDFLGLIRRGLNWIRVKIHYRLAARHDPAKKSAAEPQIWDTNSSFTNELQGNSAPNSNWYYLLDDIVCGPSTTEEMQVLLNVGGISSSTLVFRDEMKDWAKAALVLPLPSSATPTPPSQATETGGTRELMQACEAGPGMNPLTGADANGSQTPRSRLKWGPIVICTAIVALGVVVMLMFLARSLHPIPRASEIARFKLLLNDFPSECRELSSDVNNCQLLITSPESKQVSMTVSFASGRLVNACITGTHVAGPNFWQEVELANRVWSHFASTVDTIGRTSDSDENALMAMRWHLGLGNRCSDSNPMVTGEASFGQYRCESAWNFDDAKKSIREEQRFERQTEQPGDAEADLANQYFAGAGKPQDDKEAVRLYRRAAEKGNIHGHLMLGACYAKGRGVSQDEAESVRWFQRAANKGSTRGQYLLAERYLVGIGVPKDLSEGMKLMNQAATGGDVEAQVCLARSYDNKNDFSAAAPWYRKAAALGNTEAQQRLGVFYFEGRGVEPNASEAFSLFQSAAAQNDADAQFFLASCYYLGKGTTENPREAKKWLEKAAAQGHAESAQLLKKLAF